MTERGYGDNSGEEPEEDYSDLEGLTVEDILRAGQKALFIQLVGRSRSGKASHQELAILRNILKDNGLTLGIPPEKSSTTVPMDLPTFEDPDYS
jgi:hypothetical protein